MMSDITNRLGDMNLRGGEAVTFLADCPLRGVSIKVPEVGFSTVISCGNAWVSISNKAEDSVIAYQYKGELFGDCDKWQIGSPESSDKERT